MEIKTIGVVGAGAMGSGIAQVAAQNGFKVILRDIEDRFVENGIKNITSFLTKSVEKGKMTEDQKKAALGNIRGTTKVPDMKDADIVIEAIFEDLNLKKTLFKELDEVCRPEVILATNTSSMSITDIAMATKRLDRIVGMHFFNPVPLMKLVEVIRGFHTSDETIKAILDLTLKLGKESVEVKKDAPGFIVNRLMVPHMLEAIKMYEEGVASKEDIDKALKLGLNYPMGPFELMDLTGLDVIKAITDYFYEELNKENKWVAPTLFKNMMRAKRLGRKTGAGWYEYKK